jgi:hypothetical protein
MVVVTNPTFLSWLSDLGGSMDKSGQIKAKREAANRARWIADRLLNDANRASIVRFAEGLEAQADTLERGQSSRPCRPAFKSKCRSSKDLHPTTTERMTRRPNRLWSVNTQSLAVLHLGGICD